MNRRSVESAHTIRVEDERLLACFEADEPDIGTLWQLYLFFEFDEKELVEGIAGWLGKPDDRRILDCACGSGFPALELAKRGYDIACSDGSEIMLRHFARNARIGGVDLDASLVNWDDLFDRYGAAFDVVMCRGGGSYLYAGTWDRNGPPDRAVLRNSLQRFVDCVRPGGRLYVDITRSEDLANTDPQEQDHPRLLIGEHVVHLVERIIADPERGTRTWRSWLTIDGRTFEFERRSHHLPHSRLVGLLQDCGLDDVHYEEIPGESYDVYVGRRA